MLKTLITVIIKRYTRLFVSMTIICLLAVSMLTGLTSAVSDTYQSYLKFCDDYGVPDFTVCMDGFVENEKLEKNCYVDGVIDVCKTIEIQSYITTPNNDFSTAMLYVNVGNSAYKQYVTKSAEHVDYDVNVCVESRYASNNNINAGDSVNVNFFGEETKVHVENIVYSPETIYVKSNKYTLSDNKNFGYIYVEEPEFVKLVNKTIESANDVEVKMFLAKMVEGDTIHYCNELLYKCEDCSDTAQVLNNACNRLKQDFNVKSTLLKEDTSSAAYMKKFNSSFGKISLIFPAIFYVIMLFIVALFLNQIILYLKRDIGILFAMGTSKMKAVGFFVAFAITMALCGWFLGVTVGFVIRTCASAIFSDIYQIPVSEQSNSIFIILISLLASVLVAIFSVLISSIQITKISPKEVIDNRSANRTKISIGLENLIGKFSSVTKLNLCLTIQNPRRLFVSIFSIAAATAIMVLASQFYCSNQSTLPQLFEQRCLYDSEFISTNNDSSQEIKEIKHLYGIDKVEEVDYAQLDVNYNGKTYNEKFNGLVSDNSMYLYPDSDGNVESCYQPFDGVILNVDCANYLGVNLGDYVTICDKPFRVEQIAYQYMYKNSAIGKDNLKAITNDVAIGYFINQNSRNALNNYVCNSGNATVVNNREDMYDDLEQRLQPLNGIVYLLFVIGSIISFVIILIMSQGSFIEQKRLVSILRVLGFSVKQISMMWLVQELIYLIIGAIIGVGVGLVLEYLLLPQFSTDFWTFPFVCDWLIILLTVAMVALTVLLAHFISVAQIKKWNLADNTRTID